MVDIDSELFSRLTKAKSLPHPTARNFGPQAWEQEIASIGSPSPRDYQLCVGAIHFGREIRSLRDAYESRLFEGMSKRTGVLLTIAMANYNYLVLTKLARESTRQEVRKKDGPLSVGSIASQPISGPYPGSKSTSDSSIATIVDTIPHCLERALRLPENGSEVKGYWQQGSSLFAILSVEHCLRDLWQSILWEGWALTRDGKSLGIVPTDDELATFWNAWHWRQEMIAVQGPLQDAMQERMIGASNSNSPPFQDPTVVGIGGHSKDSRRFRFGSVSGRERGQSWHATENAIVEKSYLAPFLDTPLPNLGKELTCRDLQRAWCVLRDCAAVLSSKCKPKGFSDLDSVERFSLYVQRAEIERSVSFCCKISPEQASDVVTFFTSDLNNIGDLFTKGLWAYPLVPIEAGERLLITLAAVSVGSATRRIENWLDKGGLSDRLATARRGLRYEAWVREELASCMADNMLLPNARSNKNSLDRSDQQGEQVDLLIRLGGILIVGEVKCLLGPIEPMERFNYLSKLNEAGAQAVRKATWVATRPDVLSDHLGISLGEAKILRPVPIVVVNQGAGFGLLVGGARVVDFHFLRLYLTDGDYSTGAAFNFAERKGAAQFQTLYRNEREAEENFELVMARPPTLKRFLESAVWQTTNFPMSSGGDFSIAVCHFDDRNNKEAKDLISSVSF